MAEFIDTVEGLKGAIEQIPQGSDGQVHLYIDLEGHNLSRFGKLSLLTLLIGSSDKAYIIDVTNLGRDTFMTEADGGRSLKSILEAADTTKVFFDVRNDSNALFFLYDIKLAGVEDLQLVELASRGYSKQFVKGLAKCIESDANIGYEEKRIWREVKNKGGMIFKPERGGSYAAFDIRPLSADLMEYCLQDVLLMPGLLQTYSRRLRGDWWAKIREETAARIILSQQLSFHGEGRHMANGPIAWRR
ncbi:hypothetical protein K431DRAFT_285552 [Polychaeton citri CBS 116435]|uniref:3'-5' exonuclease domain-containing protein n=1 Tax=Polychaeton citri CBS 116435 TaxID=1314669 RepID=A0A9P4Q914_9PEZI|nr:hypothetical protein K431DRAFT_285552 [Polychaeton citri CBS 116435]